MGGTIGICMSVAVARVHYRGSLIIKLLAPAILLMLMLQVTASSGVKKCFDRLDIVIAVDTTSSATDTEFQKLASDVKDIATKFRIGQTETRLALISISQSAHVVASFADINSLSDFNAAVDRLRFSSGPNSISSGMSTAKSLVLNHARGTEVKMLLILVKDGRSEDNADPSSDELSRIAAEAAIVRAMGVAIHAVAPGGPWNMKELIAIFGTDYLLFKCQNKAMESVKSLKNRFCPDCHVKSEVTGPCLNGRRQVLKIGKTYSGESTGKDMCQTKIHREFEECLKKEACNRFDKNIGSCEDDGKVPIETSWQFFNSHKQSCAVNKAVVRVPCNEAAKCPSQEADVIILIDKSYAMRQNFSTVQDAAKTLVSSFEVGQNRVQVGLLIFHTEVELLASLGTHRTKAELLSIIDGISTYPRDFGRAKFTQLGLDRVQDIFRSSQRPGVGRFLVLITNGASRMPQRTFQSTALTKELGVTIFAIGVGDYEESELRTMTAPESDTNMLLLSNFSELTAWVSRFSARLCLQMAPPNPLLCNQNVSLHAISECVAAMQQFTHIDYKYDNARSCKKQMQTRLTGQCKSVCTDPIDGKQYAEGDRWTTLCQEFVCDRVNLLQILPTKKCIAADTTCKEADSAPFNCVDERGKELHNCRCMCEDGRAVLKIDHEP